MHRTPKAAPHMRTPNRQSSFPLSRRMSQPIQYQDEHEQRDAALQLEWTSTMAACGGQNSSLYKQVKALVISWDEDSDDLNTKQEVADFSTVLEELFHYKVVPALLKHGSEHLPQVQINHYISNFVFEEDGPNTLLIIYYAGHGVPDSDTGKLKLAGKRGFNESLADSNEVIWNLVETNLQTTRADVLEIFDCCYAGDLGRSQTYEKSMNFSPRSFEFLGATSSDSLTRCPGEKSFTSALIWALKKLVEEKERFTSSELSRRITSAPKFPRDQVPVLFERSGSSLERIILAPLPDAAKIPDIKPELPADTSQQYLLRLNYVFTRPPTKAEVVRFAKSSRKTWIHNNMPLDRIVWSGLSSWGGNSPSAAPFVVKAANAFKELRKRKSSAGEEQVEEEEPSHETSQEAPSVSPVSAKRPRRSLRASPSSHMGELSQLPTPQSQTPRSASEANETAGPSETPQRAKKQRRS